MANKDKKNNAAGCAALIVVGFVIWFLFGVFGTNINKEKDVISRLDGEWTVREKVGGYFLNVRIKIKDHSYQAWRQINQTDDDVENWGEPVCSGNFDLGDVHTYNNAGSKFRKIHWGNCAEINEAFFDEGGLYWGSWGPFKKHSSLLVNILGLLGVLGALALLVYVYSVFEKFGKPKEALLQKDESSTQDQVQ